MGLYRLAGEDDPKRAPQCASSGNTIHKYDASIKISSKAFENLKDINKIDHEIKMGKTD